MEILKKIKILLPIFVTCLLILNCDQNKIKNKKYYQNADVSMNILEINHKKHDLEILCLITNHSNSKLYFPIDPNLIRFISNYQIKYPINNTSFYSIFYKNDSIMLSNFHDIQLESSKNKDSLNQINDSLKLINKLLTKKFKNDTITAPLWAVRYSNIKMNGFFIEPNSSKQITLKITPTYSMLKKLLIFDIGWYCISNEKQDIELQTAIHIDSLYVNKELLLPKDFDSLKQNNIKIFYGTVVSNKIPTKVNFQGSLSDKIPAILDN